MIWREKRWLLITTVALLLLNIGFFFTYRIRYHERVRDLDRRLASAEDRLATARSAREQSERELRSYRQIEQGIESIYEDRWSTPEMRLTRLLQEISQLAIASKMIPKSTSYSQSQQKRELDISTMTISFAVQGSYQQVRRLINLLELSEEFVIIRSIAITSISSDASVINLSLHLETLFREPRNIQEQRL